MPSPAHDPEPPDPEPLSDATIRAVARRIARAVRQPPRDSPADDILLPRHELAPADENRVIAALAGLARDRGKRRQP